MSSNDAIQPVGKSREAFESKRSKILEMAQGVMAEKFGQAQTGNQNGAAPVDVTKFSREAVDELSNKNGNVDTNRADSIISALREIADKKVGEQQGQGQAGGASQNQAGGASQKKGKGGKGKLKVEWKPQTERGKLHKGRDVIGRVKITQTKPEGGDQTQAVSGAGKSKNGNSAAGGSGASSAAKSGNASAVPPAQGANTQTGNEKANETGKEEDKVELSPESAAMASQMKNSGAQVPNEVKAASEGKGIAPAQKGGGGGEVSMEKEVRTRAFGKTQTAEVTPEGELPPNAPLRTFQKLDDMPMLDSVTLHDVKGKDAVKQLQEKAKRGEINPQEITPEMIQKLKDPQAMQQ